MFSHFLRLSVPKRPSAECFREGFGVSGSFKGFLPFLSARLGAGALVVSQQFVEILK